jgi:beta-lactamase superfamily II metal-dependent hydrolase
MAKKRTSKRPNFEPPAPPRRRHTAGAPDYDEIEVSLFGPGYGECVVLHVGGGDWFVVDSCINDASGKPAALTYLESLDVDPESSVRLVAATHAHDDHVRGIAELLQACPDALFLRPAAITKREFLALLEADEEIEFMGGQAAYSEFRRIERVLVERQRGTRSPVVRGIADRPVFSRMASGDRPAVSVLALSPSDEALDRSLAEIRKLLPTTGLIRRLSSDDPNTMCMALWIEIGEVRVLLGGDLENGPAPNCGWAGVAENLALPNEKASVYKVAHHGSVNAHSPLVWSMLLDDEVMAILSPYRRGRTPRPSAEDRARICAATPSAYITADPDFRMSGGSVRMRAAELSGAAQGVRLQEGETGQVRLRRAIASGTQWNVELMRPARPLCS